MQGGVSRCILGTHVSSVEQQVFQVLHVAIAACLKVQIHTFTLLTLVYLQSQRGTITQCLWEKNVHEQSYLLLLLLYWGGTRNEVCNNVTKAPHWILTRDLMCICNLAKWVNITLCFVSWSITIEKRWKLMLHKQSTVWQQLPSGSACLAETRQLSLI